ncbi:lectin [Hymenopellis radicata]|nr:lectin [Hymenopellis radicata]
MLFTLFLLPFFVSATFAAVLPVLLQDSATRSLKARATAPVLDLTQSQWIWTGEESGPTGSAPIGSRPFRKTLPQYCTKCPVCATILIAADNTYDLYVNEVFIGGGQSFTSAQVYTVAMNAEGDNVIAVNATNVPPGGPAGLIATVLVEYSDGSSETFVTDSSWKTLQSSTAAGFQSIATNDDGWNSASEQGADGVLPWGPTALPPALDLTQAHWVWTNEVVNGAAPVGSRGFRKTIEAPCDKVPVCSKIVITADNEYTLYVNGNEIGSGDNFGSAQAYAVSGLNATENVFAVDATNTGGPAALIAIILIAYNDGTTETFITDPTWKAFTSIPAGFEEPGFDDSAWQGATDEGPYGTLPWGNVVIPRA